MDTHDASAALCNKWVSAMYIPRLPSPPPPPRIIHRVFGFRSEWKRGFEGGHTDAFILRYAAMPVTTVVCNEVAQANL